VRQTRPCSSRLKCLGVLRCLRHGHLVQEMMELRWLVLSSVHRRWLSCASSDGQLFVTLNCVVKQHSCKKAGMAILRRTIT
jgi:hypothetical protein